MFKFVNYFKDSWTELTRITWPTRAQTIRLTAAVLVFSGVLATFMTIIDLGLAQLLKRLLL